jgi:hypothetical protein
MSPLCGGYFVKDLNSKTSEVYVSSLLFNNSKLDTDNIDQALAAADGELVLHGKFGAKEPKFNTRPYLVAEAYRGLPGVTPIKSAVFYKAKDRSPKISCFSAPCPNLVATKLNTSSKSYFSRLDVKHAAKIMVDESWLINRVQAHDAIVAAKLVNGTLFQGGYEKVLDIRQVYIRLPEIKGPCPLMKVPPCDPMVQTFTRSVERCMFFDSCRDQSNCPMVKPAGCADGYTLVKWSANNAMCVEFVCDPSFIVEQPVPSFCAITLCAPGYHCDEATAACLPDAPGCNSTQLLGVWEGTQLADSGNPAQPVPPGNFQAFNADGTIALGCEAVAPAGTWWLSPDCMTIKVTLGNGSVSLDWNLVELDAANLAFAEGGDIFYYRRSVCP